MTALLICIAAVGCAITGGVLYGFSSFVMRALAQLPAGQGVAAMNSINRVASPAHISPPAGRPVGAGNSRTLVRASLLRAELERGFSVALPCGHAVNRGGT